MAIAASLILLVVVGLYRSGRSEGTLFLYDLHAVALYMVTCIIAPQL